MWRCRCASPAAARARSAATSPTFSAGSGWPTNCGPCRPRRRAAPPTRALALAAALAVDGVAERWHVGLAGSLTVQLEALADGKPDSRLARRDQAVALLRAEPAVAAAEPIDDAAVRRLVAPWLGTGDIGD